MKYDKWAGERCGRVAAGWFGGPPGHELMEPRSQQLALPEAEVGACRKLCRLSLQEVVQILLAGKLNEFRIELAGSCADSACRKRRDLSPTESAQLPASIEHMHESCQGPTFKRWPRRVRTLPRVPLHPSPWCIKVVRGGAGRLDGGCRAS